MKKIGIVGGVSWLSTVDYYSGICRRSEQLHFENHLPGAASTPEIAIESLDHRKAVAWLGTDGVEESWAQFDEYHRAALKRLERAGAEFAVIASNSPHHRLDAIVRGVKIPVISIFEETAKESARIGAAEVLILGTSVTMGSPKFREAFARHGVTAAGPKEERVRAVTSRLVAELQQSGRHEGASERLGEIARVSFREQFTGPPVVALACTELPLAFPERKSESVFETGGVIYLNTTAIHIHAAFAFASENL